MKISIYSKVSTVHPLKFGNGCHYLPILGYNKSLTHWGRVTHTYVGNLTIIGSENGLSPDQRQAISWTNDGILSIGPLGINFSEMLIEIHTFSFKKIHLEMSSGKWRPFCLGVNVLSLVVKEAPGEILKINVTFHLVLYIQMTWSLIVYLISAYEWKIDSKESYAHIERNGMSNHRRLYCLLNCLCRRRSKKTSKLRVTSLWEGNPTVTGGFPSERASNPKNVSMWWRHLDWSNHVFCSLLVIKPQQNNAQLSRVLIGGLCFYTLRPGPNRRHFADDSFKRIFLIQTFEF